MPTPKTSMDNFSLAGTALPCTRSLNGPTYMRVGTMAVHVNDNNELQYGRPIRETRQATAEPDGHGRYTLYTYRRIDFQDALSLPPESSTWTTNRLTYEPEIARHKMAELGKIWEGEGFVRYTLNGPPAPGPAPI